MEGEPCKVTDRKETCLFMVEMAQSFLRSGHGREIATDEAMPIIAQNQEDGLVLQPLNTEKAYHVCSCCACCCGFLDVLNKLPKPLDFWSSNFHAAVDMTACDGCSACEKRCQVGAVTVPARKQPAVVNQNRCIGCGLCVQTCPKKAMSFSRKMTEVRPPQTREDLYDIIMDKKKSRLGKLELSGKLFIDAIRTGRTDLLK